MFVLYYVYDSSSTVAFSLVRCAACKTSKLQEPLWLVCTRPAVYSTELDSNDIGCTARRYLFYLFVVCVHKSVSKCSTTP